MQIVRRLAQKEIFSSLSIMGLRVGMLAAKFVLSLFIARFIGLESLGIYGLIVGASGTVQAVVRGGVFNILARDAVHQTTAELTSHLRHYGAGILAIYILLVPFTAAAGWHFNMLDRSLLALGVVALEHISYDIFVLTNNLHRPKLANIILSIQSSSWIYLYCILAFFIPSMRTLDTILLFWIGGGVAAVAAVLFGTRHWPWRAALSTPLQAGWYRDNLRRSWRLYISDVINVTTMYMDRYLITLFLNLQLVGVYVLFSQVVNAIINLVGAGVLQVYKPRLIMAHKDPDPNVFRRTYRDCIVRTLGSAFLLALGSGVIVPFMVAYTKKPLAMHYLPLLWLMLGALMARVGVDITGSYLYAQHRDQELMTRNILGLVLAGAVGSASLLLIGIYGVVATMVIVNGTMILFTIVTTRNTMQRRLP